MSTETPHIIETATVGIYTSDMKKALFMYNKKLDLLVPAGGKRENCDRDIQDTALREIGEELYVALFPGTGVFLEQDGKPTTNQPVIYIDGYNLLGKPARDFLFYFRLHEKSPFTDTERFLATTQAEWLTKNEILHGRKEVNTVMKKIIDGNIRENILRVMK